jgi:hypothetical protein
VGKPHKYAWNGVDIQTSLSIEQVANMAQRAAQESTGDLLKGKQRVVSTRSADRQIEFRINDYLISFNKLMLFFLDFEVRSGATFASTRIDWYMTNQQTVGGFIPVSTKRMVAHHTYMQFVRNLADQVRAADPSARVSLREGVEMDAGSVTGAAAQSLQASIPLPPPPPLPPVSHSGETRMPPKPPHPPSSPPPSSVVALSPSLSPVPTATFAPPPPQAKAPQEAGPSLGLVTAVPGFSRPLESPLEVPTPVSVEIEEEDLEATRLSAGRETLNWVIELPGGDTAEIRDAIVVGRNPAPPANLPSAAEVRLNDHTQSVSKTHATLQARDGLLWVTDLHSTNGTALTNLVGDVTPCPAGKAVPASDGWQIGFGDFVVRLRGN